VKDRKDELNNETFCIETCREFCLNDTQMEINNVQDCSRSVLAVWLLKFMGKMLQKHQVFCTLLGPNAATKASLTALMKAAECSSRNWKYYCLMLILECQICISLRL